MTLSDELTTENGLRTMKLWRSARYEMGFISRSQAIHAESLIWWSPVAAGALSEDQLRVLPEDHRSALKSATFGRPGVDILPEDVLTSGATDFTSNLALTLILAAMVVKCYLLLL